MINPNGFNLLNLLNLFNLFFLWSVLSVFIVLPLLVCRMTGNFSSVKLLNLDKNKCLFDPLQGDHLGIMYLAIEK